MSSPRTVSRLVRCGVRDLASCFYACRFPLVEDSGNILRKQPRKLKRTVTFDNKCDTKGDKAIKEIPVGKKSIKSSSRGSNNNTSIREEGEQNLAELYFDDEDYIVFSFREDGAIDMTSEGKTSSSEEFEYDKDDDYEADDEDASYKASCSNTSRPASRKLHYREHDHPTYIEESISGNEVRKIGEETAISRANVGERESNEQRIEQRVDSFESCDSIISENSAGSFAFPVLSAKWIGSPVHMPRSRDYEPKSVRLHCFRF